MAIRRAGKSSRSTSGNATLQKRLRAAEARLRQLQERHDAAMGAINEAVYDWDLARGRFRTSQSMRKLLGLPAAQLTLEGWQRSVHPDDYPRFRAATIAHLKGETERFECDYRFRAVDGSWRWARTHGLATRDRKGRAVRMVGSTGDITELKSAELELRRARDEAHEALDRQTATAGILGVISSSPTDVQPVFDAIVQSALRLFEGAAVGVALPEGGQVRAPALAGADPEQAARWKSRFPFALSRDYMHGAAILDCRMVDVPDAQRTGGEWAPGIRNFLESGYRAITIMPMVRAGAAIGAISVCRLKPGPLSPKQRELLKTFADQAVIAIENVRLFNETKEALEQQTATAEILNVISRSPADVAPVFRAILANAVRLCEASVGTVFTYDGEALANVAHQNASPEFARFLEQSRLRPSRETTTRRCALERRTVHTEDLLNDPEYAPPEFQRRENVRTVLSVPMMRDEVLVGVITLWRREVRPFSAKQVALVETFADQAVIAIENVRLFNETREALEQQKASAEVLGAISSSIADTAPVFDKILESCQRLFAGTIVGLNLVREDGRLHIGAYHGAHREAFEKIFPIPLDSDSGSAIAIRERRVTHYPDARAPEVPPPTRRGCDAIGVRSVIFAPVLWEGRGLGSIFVGRDRASTFSCKEIALLETFADQAAIAIQNARLFNETKAALDEQTATAEVLRVMTAARADVQPVFDAIAQHAVRLCGALSGIVFRYDGELLHVAAHCNLSEETLRVVQRVFPYAPDERTVSGRAVMTRSTQRVEDVLHDTESVAAFGRSAGFRRTLSVPMVRDGLAVGAISVTWPEPGPIADSQVKLLGTFADQALIAIENVRLFNEIQEKSRQLEIASRHKSEFLANMSHELRTPLNAIIGFTRIVMRRSQESMEPKQYENLEKILLSAQNLLGLINAILDLSKVEAGRVEVVPAETPLAPVLEQCLRTVEPLVRADGVVLVREFDDLLPALYVDEEKLRQIVINLLSNAAKFTERGSIRVRARAQNGAVDIAVSDTGIGIAADKIEKIFDAFEQVDATRTRQHGGTGLGLTIARRLARLMGGELRAESERGSGSTFTLTLPVRYEARA